MAPQQKEANGDTIYFESDHEEHFHGLEERTLNFSFINIIHNLINLDYSKVVWRNVIIFAVLHVYYIYGIYALIFLAQWKTNLYSLFIGYLAGIGITMGAHRLWTHRSYKANFGVRLVLAAFQTLAIQNDIFEWSRDHRVHHKYSETDADPHNAKRGLFFAHMGWLMYKKHPDVRSKGKNIDTSDLMADPIVKYQRKFYVILVLIIGVIIPVAIPYMFWDEGFVTSLMIAGVFRYVSSLHGTWTVNSLAHWVGTKPYDKTIYPSQNTFVALVTLGEGWHNFHHVFPYDYRTSEFGCLTNINLTSTLIEFFAKLGWVHDLRSVDRATVSKRMLRTGSSSQISSNTLHLHKNGEVKTTAES